MSTVTLQEWPKKDYSFTLPIRYQLHGDSQKGVVVCFHGYQDHALSMLRRLGWIEQPPKYAYLALNAPFPVPIWKADGFIEAYSWYFRDTSRSVFISDPGATAIHITDMIQQLVPPPTPIVLFGFSQGGFLAPFVAKKLSRVKAIVGLGCNFPEANYLDLSRNIKVHAIHGSHDERIPLGGTQLAFQTLQRIGFKGEFREVDLGHKVDRQIVPILNELIQAEFP